MPKKRLTLTEQIRQAIEASGESRYRIARETGVSEPSLSRFMGGERGMNLATLEKLAAFLDIRITIGPAKVKPAARRKGR